MAEYDVVEMIPKEDGSGFEERPNLGTKLLVTELDEDGSLSEGDIIQAEAVGSQGTDYLFRSASGAGGGITTAWAKIVRSLKYPNPDGTPPEGYSTYLARLVTTTYSTWTVGTVYLKGDQTSYGGYVYEAIPDSHTATPLNHPDATPASNAYWKYISEIELEGIATEGDYISKDLRYWGRWFVKNDIIPVVMRGGVWYIFQTVIPFGISRMQSLSWNENEKRLMAVFS